MTIYEQVPFPFSFFFNRTTETRYSFETNDSKCIIVYIPTYYVLYRVSISTKFTVYIVYNKYLLTQVPTMSFLYFSDITSQNNCVVNFLGYLISYSNVHIIPSHQIVLCNVQLSHSLSPGYEANDDMLQLFKSYCPRIKV